jgi:hypothetical protein
MATFEKVGLTKQMKNVFDALKQNKRKWQGHLFPLSNLQCYDGRTVNALMDRGMIVVHYSDHDGIGKEGYYLDDE